MRRTKHFFNQIASATLVELIKLLAFPLIAAAVAFLSSKSVLDYLNVSGITLWSVVFIATIGVAWATIYAYEVIRGDRPNFAPIDSNYEFAKVSIEMKYINRDELRYRKSKEVIAKKNNLRSFYDKFHWTGDPSFSYDCEDPSHKLIDRGKRNVWTCYEVDFQKSLKQGDREKVSLVWDLSDKSRDFVPFISVPIDHPTGSLTLRLDAQAIRDKVSRVLVEVSPLLGADDPYETEELKSDDGLYTYETLTPKLLHHYEMRWIVVD